MEQVINIQIEGSVQWRAFRDPTTRMWVALCDALKLTSHGETWAEMCTNIDDIIQTLFLDLAEQGPSAFGAFLRKQGWAPTMPLPTRLENVHFDIPMPVMPVESVSHAASA